MIKRSDCNLCTTGCEEKIYKTVHFSTRCKRYRPNEPTPVPLLLHLMASEHKVQGLFDVLNHVGLTLEETTKYPGFRLTT